MVKIDRWKSNKEIDPEYPYYSRRAEDGTIYYSVPLEAPNDVPADAAGGDADRYEYSYLPLLGGKNLRVYCWETADREWAYRVRSMVNTQCSQERRFAERCTVVPEVLGDGLNDGNRRVSCKAGEEPEKSSWEGQETAEQDHGTQYGYEQHGWPDVEKQVLDRIEIQAIRELVINADPRCWEIFYRVRLYGEEAKAVADRMGISVQRVHQLAGKVREIAEKHRRKNR